MWSSTPFFVLLVALGAIDAAPKLTNLESNYNPYAEIAAIIGRKPTRTFGLLQLGGGYGVAKRLPAPSEDKFESKTEKHRRGPLNGLIPGGAFGRAARSNCIRNSCRSPTYDTLIKLLKGPVEEKFHPDFSFDVVENRSESDDGQGVKDGQEKIPTGIDVYMPYQYKQSLESNKYI